MAILLPACALWAALVVEVSHVSAAEEHATAVQPMDDVAEVVDEMVGKAPPGHQTPEEAIDYQQPPLIPEIPLLVFTLVLFGGFVLLMGPAVWKPLIAGLDARETRIVKAEADARAARVEVEQLTAKAEKRLAEVYSEVKTIVAQARAAAEAKKLEIVSQAEADAQRIKQDALTAIAQARTAVLAELEQTIDQQVALATEHVAGRRL